MAAAPIPTDPVDGRPPRTVVATVVDAVRPDEAQIEAAGLALRAGGLVAFPTETVYGLGASVARADAISRVFSTKGRPATDPLIVHVADVAGLEGVVAELDDRARALADAFWPGPLTLVLDRGPLIGDDVTAGGPGVGVRIPAHPVALALLAAAGSPVAAPSANRFGRISPTTGADVVAELSGRLDPDRDMVLDGGATPLGIESTVVALTGPTPRVLRPGGVPWEDLEAVIGDVEHVERRVVADGVAASAPGGSLRHYAPDTPLVLVEGDDVVVADLVAALRAGGIRAAALDLPADPRGAASVLYRWLRRADDGAVDLLLVAALAPSGLGRAVNDRLYRAAHGRVVTSADATTVDRVAALARR